MLKFEWVLEFRKEDNYIDFYMIKVPEFPNPYLSIFEEGGKMLFDWFSQERFDSTSVIKPKSLSYREIIKFILENDLLKVLR